MAGNRAVVYSGSRTVKVENLDDPKLVDPRGRQCEHGVIIKLVTTNICGSDLHIYRGRFVAPEGMVLGHENTGQVVERGQDVEFINVGDLVSVPFNVACGRCRNCRERHTDICMTTNPKVPCGAYGSNLGDWRGGQAEYMMVPYADFQLLKFPDKDQAMERNMHDILFENQQALEVEDLAGYARAIGLDLTQFLVDLADHTDAPRVREDFMSGVLSGANDTPSFFINGVRHQGSFDLDTLQEAVESAIGAEEGRC